MVVYHVPANTPRSSGLAMLGLASLRPLRRLRGETQRTRMSGRTSGSRDAVFQYLKTGMEQECRVR